MRPEFLDDVSAFLTRLKKDSEKLKGYRPFETLMQGLSDGTVDFRWGLGGRLMPHLEPIEKPNLIWLRWLVSAPFIYLMIIPVVFLDLTVSFYQAICFRLWKLPQVHRSKYIIIDRHRLSYLDGFQKFNCIYCGYANGVMAYARMVAGETERYWCPVKHDKDVPAPHKFYIKFADFDDPEGWDALHSTGMNDWRNEL